VRGKRTGGHGAVLPWSAHQGAGMAQGTNAATVLIKAPAFFNVMVGDWSDVGRVMSASAIFRQDIVMNIDRYERKRALSI